MKTFNRVIAGLLGTAVLVAPAPVLAHTDEYLATQQAPHGGQLRVAGPFHLELVVAKEPAAAAEKSVTVYVTDHGGTPVDTAGGGGSVTLLGGGTKVSATLAPAGGNALKATAVYASTADLKAVVNVRMADGAEAGARFVPLAKRAPAKADWTPQGDPHAGHH